MANSKSFVRQQRWRAAIVLSVALIILLNRFFSCALLPQIGIALTDSHQTEMVYAFLVETGLVSFFLRHHWMSALFDITLFFSPIMYLVTGRRFFVVLFTLLTLFYFLAYNVTAFHHYHGLFAIVVVTTPFWTTSEKRFNLLWEAARYYWLYVFTSAALWKIFRGSVFYGEQLSNILKQQQLDLLLQQPESIRAQTSQYLIIHPNVSHVVLMANVLVQLSFAVGFFTKKFDTALFVLSFVFCAANYFVMNIVSAELLILNLTLLNWNRIDEMFNKNSNA